MSNPLPYFVKSNADTIPTYPKILLYNSMQINYTAWLLIDFLSVISIFPIWIMEKVNYWPDLVRKISNKTSY